MVGVGQAVQVALAALADDLISNDEMASINRECHEAIEALTRLKQIARTQPVPNAGVNIRRALSATRVTSRTRAHSGDPAAKA